MAQFPGLSYDTIWIVAGNGEIALRAIRAHNGIIQNNIMEGKNSPFVAYGDEVDFLNNTFIGTVNPIDRQDTGITLAAAAPNRLVKQNSFNTSGSLFLVSTNSTGTVIENNFNSDTRIKVGSTWGTPVNAENNWWGDTDPSDNVDGDVDFTPFATKPFKQY